MTFIEWTDAVEVERHRMPDGNVGRTSVAPASSRDALLKQLWDAGCGAWVGRSACGEAPVAMMAGGVDLAFSSFRGIHHEGVFAVPGCARHSVSRDAWVAQMARQVRRSQQRELAKFKKMHGIA